MADRPHSINIVVADKRKALRIDRALGSSRQRYAFHRRPHGTRVDIVAETP